MHIIQKLTETVIFWVGGLGWFLSSYTLAIHTNTWGMNVTTYKELTATGGMWLTSQTRHCSGALAHVQTYAKPAQVNKTGTPRSIARGSYLVLSNIS